jgi:hypothetical protein
LSLAEIPDTLDVETDQLATELKSWRTDQLRKLAERVAQKDARAWTGDFTDLRPDDYAIPYTKELYRAVRQTQQRVLRFGATQVRMELKRQGLETPLYLSDGTDPFWYLSLALAEGDTCDLSAASSSPAAARSMTVTSAYLLTHKLGHDWLDLILSSSLRHRRSGKQGILLEQEVLAECLPLAGAGVNAAARAEVNESFALGRALEVNQLFGQQRTETSARLSLATPELPPGRYIDYVVHSAVMDQNTCDRCAELDGTVFEYGSPEQVAAEPPYAECLGREYCRCVHIFVLGEGAGGEVPAAEVVGIEPVQPGPAEEPERVEEPEDVEEPEPVEKPERTEEEEQTFLSKMTMATAAMLGVLAAAGAALRDPLMEPGPAAADRAEVAALLDEVEEEFLDAEVEDADAAAERDEADEEPDISERVLDIAELEAMIASFQMYPTPELYRDIVDAYRDWVVTYDANSSLGLED